MAGDFSQRVPLEGKEGVVLSLRLGDEHDVRQHRAVMDDLGVVLAALAEGNLTRALDAEYQGAFGQLKDNANTTSTGCRKRFPRSRQRRPRSPTRRRKSPPAQPICRSAPKPRPPVWKRRRLRWKKSPSPCAERRERDNRRSALSASTHEVAGRGGAWWRTP